MEPSTNTLPSREEVLKDVREEAGKLTKWFVDEFEIQKHFAMTADEFKIFEAAFTAEMASIKVGVVFPEPQAGDTKSKIMSHLPGVKYIINSGKEYLKQIWDMEIAAVNTLYAERDQLETLSPESFIPLRNLALTLAVAFRESSELQSNDKLLPILEWESARFRQRKGL